ncbi:MAG: quinol:cytochrome C oxidoreductase [Myxococcales bacterium]|nr:quinol:cytochrome C oxidoreductase [Myxococcales bacterium]
MATANKQAKEESFGDNIRMDGLAQKVMQTAGGVGVLALAVSAGLGFAGGQKTEFMHAYLVAFAWILSIGLGALWWVTLQHLVNAKWSIVLRRVGELLASNMPLLFVLSLPIVIPMLMGDTTLYIWADAHKMHADHMLHKKAAYLNMGFFGVRLVIYFGFWSLLSRFFFKKSLEQDKTGAPEIRSKLQGVSAPSMILLALTLTFASIDFLMTLEPKWYSTIFGVYYFAGAVVSFHSFLALTTMWLQKNGRLAKSVTTEHFHDIGKMMFAFTVFWAYIAFSQFMLIWYANMPEETEWYHIRSHEPWGAVSYAMIGLNFVVPFFGLLSRHVKRNRKALGFWAVWILVVHWLDMFWLVKPHMHTESLPFSILDITCTVGVLGLFIAGAAFSSQKVNLVPVKDPRLEKSLAFENF